MEKTKFALGLILAAFLLTLSFSIVSADRTVNYNVNYAVIEDNNTVTTTSSPITGVNATLYNCTSVNCSTVGTVVGRFNSGSTNILSIVFPENLTSQYGYVIYAFKDGYIGWEQSNVIRYGNGTVNSTAVFYMSRMRNGYAPVMNLSVSEQVPTNRPIRINMNVSIDSDTYSAIQRSTHSNVPLNENVQTKVTLEISNSTAVIYTTNQTLNIPYSGVMPVSFDYAGFSSAGDYNVKVSSDVTDLKILNSIRQSASANIKVINQSLVNYTYTLIQQLSAIPAQPVQNQNVVFSFNYLSAFINSSNDSLPANTIVNMTIFKDSSLFWNSITGLGSSGTYSFNNTFSNYGSYRVVVIGTPNDTRGNSALSGSQEMTFVIGVANNNSGTINSTNSTNPSTPSNSGSTSTQSSNYIIESRSPTGAESLPLVIPGNSTIELNRTAEQTASYKGWFGWLLGLTIVLLIVVILIYVFRFVV